MRRVLVGLGLAAVLLGACTIPPSNAPASIGTPVDSECVSGKAFIASYTGISGRYDPQLTQDRQQLAAATNRGAAGALLRQLSSLLDSYANDLAALKAPPDFADELKAVVAADRDLSQAALTLAGSSFTADDQAKFTASAAARTSAAHDLQLEVEFVTSECG